ncbi:MAG: RNA polymerase sigma factor [Acidobacteriota bacterium]
MKVRALRPVTSRPARQAADPAVDTDKAVVARVLAGQRDDFEILVRRHHRPIFNYIYRMVGHADRAADLTQEVFLKVYTALATFNPSFRFTTWLYRIASNRVIDHLRHRRMTLVPLDASASDTPGTLREVAGATRSAEARLLDRESARDISHELAALPAEYRELIVLRHFQHRSYEEIARVKGSPLGTIKNRLFRAREALRRRMEAR